MRNLPGAHNAHSPKVIPGHFKSWGMATPPYGKIFEVSKSIAGVPAAKVGAALDRIKKAMGLLQETEDILESID